MTPETHFNHTPRHDALRIEDLTRREFMFNALAAAFLIACGDDDDDEQSGGSTSAAFPVTVQHKHGSTTINAEPRRIFTFGPTDEDMVLALGIVPVGLTDWWENYAAGKPWPWAQPKLGSAEYAVIPLDGEVHYEEIAALDPDLIIGQYCGMTAEEYQRLSQIAPTVAQSGEFEDWQAPWQLMSRNIAQALGKVEEGEALIAQVDAAFARVRETYPQFADHTVLYVERGEGQFTIRSGTEPRVQVLTNMGLKVPEAYAASLGEFGKDFSDEQLSVLDEADLVVWITDEAGRDALLDNPVYQSLDLAKNNRHVFVLDEVLFAAINWSSVLSLPYAAEHLAPLVAAALEA